MTVDVKRAARITRLVGSCNYDEATAARMVEATQYLTDDEFAAHANFLAERRAAYKKATEQGVSTPAKVPPQGTSLPAPKADPTPSSTLAADVAAYIADVFNLDDEEQDAAARTKAQQGKGDDTGERTRADMADYLPLD